MNFIESTGKNIDEAIKAGLEQLGLTLDDVEVEIISSGGWFKKAKVKLTVVEQDDDDLAELKKLASSPVLKREKKKEEVKKAEKAEAKEEKPVKVEEKAEKVEIAQNEADVQPKTETEEPKKKEKIDKKPRQPKEKKPVEKKPVKIREEKEYPPATEEQIARAKAYVEGLLAVMKIEGSVEVVGEKNIVKVNIVTEDNAIVIGHRGETLDAIQALTKRVIEDDDSHLRVVADCQGYREKREESLIHLARRTADRCAKRGRKISLEPMDSMQRKIIHSALTDDDRVFTRSDGKEPYRRVVVFPVRRRENKNNQED